MKYFNKKRIVALALSAVMTTGFITYQGIPQNMLTASVAEAKTTISLTQDELSLVVGDEEPVAVLGTAADVIWSSTKPKIASVSKAGVISAKKKGKTTIIANVNGKKLKCSVTVGAEPLSENWTKNSANAKKIKNYVEKATNESNKKSYIPEEDRIAVFDMDGTLLCETYPTYYDTTMFVNYCLYDHPDKVGSDVKKVATEIEGKSGSEVEELYPTQVLGGYFAKAYAGLTTHELYDYSVEFGKKKTSYFSDLKYGKAFYKPMVDVVKYLSDNDFEIYIVSGTERNCVRAIIDNSPLKDYIDANHIIGTEFEIKVKGHETETDDSKYQYAINDDLVYTGKFIRKGVKASKVITIEREIGKTPVLAFGNSSGDNSMCYYTLSNDTYEAKAFLLVADDATRERGNEDNWATKKADYKDSGINLVSMKKEFKNIYKNGVMPK